MAYPTKNFSALQAGFDAQVNAAKSWMELRRTEMAAGPVVATNVVGVGRNAAAFAAAITAHKSQVANTAGFGAFVAADKGVTVGALGTSIDSVKAAVDAVAAAAVAALPVNASGYLLIHKINGGGAMVERTLSSAETSALQSALAAAVAEIG